MELSYLYVRKYEKLFEEQEYNFSSNYSVAFDECPVCNGKTRIMIYKKTTLKYFPLYCPKCKLEKIIDVEQGELVKVKEYIS